MKKLIAVCALVALTSAGALSATKTASAAQITTSNKTCSVKPLGNPSAGERFGGFIVQGRVATIQFNVVDNKKGCKNPTVALKSYLAPAANGEPHDQQELQKVVEKTVGPGNHQISIDMTPNGCFYQLDFVKYTSGPGKNEMLAFKLGGQKNCIPPTVNTCDALTASKQSRVSYAFQAKATASGRATLIGFNYNFGDGQTATVANGATQHNYANPGTYTVLVNANFTIKPQFDGDGKTISISSPTCTTTVTVDQPPVAAYECTSLTASATSLYSFNYAVKYLASGGASLKTVDFNFGDTATQIGVTPANLGAVTHTYTKAGTYTTTATLHFSDANGSALSDATCSAVTTIEVCAINPSLPIGSNKCVAITPATPTTPIATTPNTIKPAAELVHTGPGSVAALFATLATVGAVAHNLLSRRRQA